MISSADMASQKERRVDIFGTSCEQDEDKDVLDNTFIAVWPSTDIFYGTIYKLCRRFVQ